MNIETVNELIASLESAGELSIRETKVMALAKAFKQLAAENVTMLRLLTDISENHVEYFSEGEDGMFAGVPLDYVSEINMYVSRDVNAENPFSATDRIYAGVKADGRAEGINFAASRLAAAFNHGFVDKPMAEVGDVVRMILDAKADLANSPIPPEDGLSGEYAEKALAEWEVELREGADK
ncbi:hypothetical protein [Klebsiella pneumoniae]|uniref:hypothetical protein n=1 Tax=Klebsiella pneumoniae TaxID=573 RepID=UPI0010EEB69B|nr:hypothetical protein [Klebsiella pneumoniae]EMB5617984.1 hypothetical protein [Klebsiella pneumoniae]VGF57352.1 Uncharacterised protein [Klebsiella pneumoniae]